MNRSVLSQDEWNSNNRMPNSRCKEKRDRIGRLRRNNPTARAAKSAPQAARSSSSLDSEK